MTAVNQSKVKMFRRCQKQFSFRYDYARKFGGKRNQEMVPKRQKVQLYRGTWLHALLEAHHREWAVDSGFDPELVFPDEPHTWREVHANFEEEYDGLFEEEKEDLGDLPGDCERLFRGYLRFWGDTEDQFTVARLSDGRPAIEFVVEASLGRWGIQSPFKGRIDLVVQDHEYGGAWVWDHKWVKRVPTADERMMSPQSIMYVWALRKQGLDARGFLNNYGRTKAPTIPRVLQRGTLSMAQRMDTDYWTYLRAIKKLHGPQWKYYAKHVYREKLLSLRDRDVLWYDRQRFPIDDDRIRRCLQEFVVSARDIERRNKAHPPRSYFYNCKFGCDYHDLCVAEFTGLDVEPLIQEDFQFVGERYEEEVDLMKD